MSEIKLKSCPFCRGGANLESESRFIPTYYDPDGSSAELEHWIRCEKCGAQTGLFKTERDAAEAWNRRVDDE